MSYSKYRAIKTVIDGIKFDSKREAQYYQIFKCQERAGEIRELKLQVPYEFKLNGKKMFTYKADFTYLDKEGKQHIIDVKGIETSVFRLKKKIIEEDKKIKIEIVK